MSGTVTVLYFAALRERAGRASETVSVFPGETVGTLLTRMRAADPRLEAAFAGPGTVRVAVSQKLTDFDAALSGGEEVAFFPPMTGG